MSVKIKIVIGFIFILLMVLFQSIYIISKNNDKDKLSMEVLTLYQMNTTIKDKVIEVKSIESDTLNKITTRQVFLGEKDQQPMTSSIIIMQGLEQWYNAFVMSHEYSILNAPRQQIIQDIKTHIESLRSCINQIRKISPENVDERMAVYNGMMFPTINKFYNSSKDFIGLNSLFFSSTNKNMLEYSEKIRFNQFVLIGLALLLIIFVIFYSQFLLSPLNWLMDGIAHISKGDLGFKVKKRSNDELGRLADQFNLMSTEIRTHREHLEDLVQKRTEQLLEAKEELEKINDNLVVTNKSLEDARRIMDMDMKMAINVQSSLFMKKPPVLDEWDISFYFKPMSGVSGDMYDFYFDNDNNFIGLSMMDVSGHGIASGLVTMIAKSISTRVFAAKYKNMLGNILEDINSELISELGNIDNYLTGILLKFRGDIVEYANAGHTELLVRRADINQTSIIKPSDDSNYKGLFLGLEAMKSKFSSLSFKVMKDDVILIFSDCLNESVNALGDEYGIERIIESLNTAEGKDSQSILNHVIGSLLKYTGTDQLDDDLTAICIRRKI